MHRLSKRPASSIVVRLCGGSAADRGTSASDRQRRKMSGPGFTLVGRDVSVCQDLYSNKEVFLQELISNASDVQDKLRFLSATEPEFLKHAAVDFDIRIQANKDNGIITITQELVDCLGTIAQSGNIRVSEGPKGKKNEEKEKVFKQEFSQTCEWIKKRLGVKAASVQISNRLGFSLCPCLWKVWAVCKYGKAQTVGDTSSLDFMRGRRVFEINIDHPIVHNLNDAFRNSPNDEDALRAIPLLYDTALVFSGFTPENPVEMGGKMEDIHNDGGGSFRQVESVVHQYQQTGNQHAVCWYPDSVRNCRRRGDSRASRRGSQK